MQYKTKKYEFVIGWPSSETMSKVYHDFYGQPDVTEEMEQTQLGINFVLSFVKHVRVSSMMSIGDNPTFEAELDLT